MATKGPSASAAGHEPSTHLTEMKAVVQHRYGAPDALAVEETGIPAVGDGDVLIRVHAAGVSYPDAVMTRGIPYIVRLVAGPRRPRHPVRGMEVADTIIQTGAGAARHRRAGLPGQSKPSREGTDQAVPVTCICRRSSPCLAQSAGG